MAKEVTHEMADNGLMTMEQFCAKHNLSRSSAYKFARASMLKLTKLHGGTRIAPKHEAEWLASLPVTTGIAA